MTEFLVVSIVGSVVLTVLLNLLPRLFPGQAERTGRALEDRVRREFPSDDRADPADPRNGPQVRVWFPWRTMLAVSIGLTVSLNLPALFR